MSQFGAPTKELIKRRLEFVVAEISSATPKYDQAITFTLRSLSNYASVGFDGNSFQIKRQNDRISDAAKDLRVQLNDDRLWASNTINEHPLPLKDLWKKWSGDVKNLTIHKIWADLVDHPMITVTKAEDSKLREKAKHGYKDWRERYANANILIHE